MRDGGKGLIEMIQRQLGIRFHQSFRVDHVQHRHQQCGVGAGPDEVMLGRNLGGLGAAWIDHYHFATARLDRFQSFRHIGHRHHAAVGSDRIATENQEVIGVVDIGDRDQELMAEHQQRGQLLRQLID